mgnify:FL=1
MARRLHFFRRGGVYCWRRRLPRYLAVATGTTHLNRSLRTRDVRIARIRALRLSAAVDDFLFTREAQMTDPTYIDPDTAEEFLGLLYELIIRECENWAANPPEVYTLDQDPDDNTEEQDDQIVDFMAGFPWDREREWREALARFDHREAADRLHRLMAHEGVTVYPASGDFKRLARRGMKVGIRAFQRFHQNHTSDAAIDAELDEVLEYRRMMRLPVSYDFDTAATETQSAPGPKQDVAVLESHRIDAPQAPLEPPTAQPQPAVGSGACCTLGEAVSARMKAQAGGAWTGKTLADAKTSARLVLDYFGASTPVDVITKKMAREYRSDLGRIPTMHGKRGRYEGLTLQECVAEADAFDEEILSGAIPADQTKGRGFRDGMVARLKLKTTKKHLSFAKGVIDQVMEDDNRLQTNPFAGLQYSNAEIEKQGGNSRQMWRDQDIAALLASPIWRGCAGPEQRDVPGDQLIKDARYWVPLLALFAGLRLEEACQLEADDIEKIEGIDCIAIRRGPYKTVKSPSSIRHIPVHSVLKSLGFLELAEKRRGALHAKLFPELERSGPHSLYGYGFSKFFTAYRRSVDLYEMWMDFHSLRTTFSTNILRQTKTDTLVSVLLGHKLRGETSTNYFRGFRAQDMIDTVELVDFGKHIQRWA